MNRLHLLFSGAALATGVVAFSVLGRAHGQKPDPAAKDRYVMKLVSANSGFSMKLLHLLAAKPSSGNVFVSPLSISNALGMAMNGARGTTRSEISAALGLQGLSLSESNAANKMLLDSLVNESDASTVTIGNSVWFDQRIRVKPAFEKACAEYFNAGATRLNFANPSAAAAVNSWVSEATHGRIPQIVSPGDLAGQAAVLTNAIYFKGKWLKEFKESETQDAPFGTGLGQKRTVKMMHLRTNLAYAETPEFQQVEVPYGGDRLRFTILLPRQSKDVSDVIRVLADGAGMPKEEPMQDVELFLPKFKVNYKVVLNEALKSVGMPTAFGPHADFKDMSPDAAEISKVIHIANLDVDEKGAVAAAATAITIRAMAVMRPRPEKKPIIVRVDHAFVVFIRDGKTGAILFAGVVRNPG